MIKYNLTIVAVLMSMTAQAQLNADTIQQRLMRYTQNYPQEKIYLHLDKPHYSPGDTVWYKAYITDAVNHLADSVSKNTYVQLIRKDNGKPVSQQMIKNVAGFSHGHISLADTLAEGVYEIRSFTNWMRNFPENFFFNKEIYVRKRLETKYKYGAEELALLQVDDLQFFPEGGNLIEGLSNRVSFKAVNRLGKGVDLAAFIISGHKDTVAVIQSIHLGMGSFIFTPKVGEKYFVRIDKSSTGGSNKSFDLPPSLAQGYTFFVDNLSHNDMIKVVARNNFSTKDRPFLIGHCRGNILFKIQSTSEGNTFSWSLPKSDIPDDGVIQLTLFNSQGIPQCERLIYNDTNSPLAITVTPDKTEYQPHEKVTLSVNVKDFEGNPVQGNFSLAATDEFQVAPLKNAENIYNYFYLSSDIQSLSKEVKGDIEQPGYYFDKSNVDASVHLDILLMTQGWRRFLWNDVLKRDQFNHPEVYEIETGINVSGTAKLLSGGKLKEPLNMTMMYSTEKGSKKDFASTKTDLEGNFTFRNLHVNEPTSAFIQGAKDNGSRSTQIITRGYQWPQYKPTYEPADPLYADTEQMKLFLERQKRWAEMDEELSRHKVVNLKEVEVKGKRTEYVVDTRKVLYAGTNLYTVPVNNSNCRSAPSLLAMLQGRVPGLQIEMQRTSPKSIGKDGGRGDVSGMNDPIGEKYIVEIRGLRSFNGANSKIVYLVDGIITDQMFLNSIPPCTVESIDVVNHSVAIYNAQGLISILTKAGNPNYVWASEEPRGSVIAGINGYETPRQFYRPKYSSTAAEPNSVPDFRSTLYWNPVIKTDAHGNAKVTFWNSDERTSVRVIIEGISSEGTPGVASTNYKVE